VQPDTDQLEVSEFYDAVGLVIADGARQCFRGQQRGGKIAVYKLVYVIVAIGAALPNFAAGQLGRQRDELPSLLPPPAPPRPGIDRELQTIVNKPPLHDRLITCDQGMENLSVLGFTNISVRSCRGNIYKYFAFHQYAKFEIEVARENGRIIAARRLLMIDL
jgi:hypothetical protein